MKRLLLVLALLASVSAIAADKPRDPGQHFFNESFWDFTEELQNAREAGKQGILLTFEKGPESGRAVGAHYHDLSLDDQYRAHDVVDRVQPGGARYPGL